MKPRQLSSLHMPTRTASRLPDGRPEALQLLQDGFERSYSHATDPLAPVAYPR
jgi:hypothetical protein